MYDLSILIPARNEMFLAKTVEDICINKRGKTEVIVVLDGQWASPSLAQHDDVTVVYLPESIGQRAATNLAARLSKAKYVMKVDAHCAFDEGFDVKLMADMQDDWTVVPTMRNLHAFNWKCKKCGNEWYQSPTPDRCYIETDPKRHIKEVNPNCDSKEFERNIVWIAKTSPQSNAYRFDKTLHFQYFDQLADRFPKDQKLTESMSIQGSCFMLTRERYWALDICDEGFGSWGQQGVEVACKTWLSGGKVIINRNTWYAHMFRTQGGDFGFPYELTGSAVDHARNYSRELFLENKWPLAKHPLQWLVDRFAPVPDWHDIKDPGFTYTIESDSTKGIIYYTDNLVDEKIGEAVRNKIVEGAKHAGISGKNIVSVSLKPLKFGKNIVMNEERGYLTMAKQILAGLEKLQTKFVFFCEHDVIYDPSHFEFTPPTSDKYYYNMNSWIVRSTDGHAVYYDHKSLSGLCADRQLLLTHFKERVKRIEAEGFSRAMGFEPGTHNRKERIDDVKSEGWNSTQPNYDIRHGKNLTQARWRQEDFRDQRNCRNWKETDLNFEKLLE